MKLQQLLVKLHMVLGNPLCQTLPWCAEHAEMELSLVYTKHQGLRNDVKKARLREQSVAIQKKIKNPLHFLLVGTYNFVCVVFPNKGRTKRQ